MCSPMRIRKLDSRNRKPVPFLSSLSKQLLELIFSKGLRVACIPRMREITGEVSYGSLGGELDPNDHVSTGFFQHLPSK